MPQRRQRASQFLLLLLLVVAILTAATASFGLVNEARIETYTGTQYWNPNATRAVHTAVETRFARCQLHTVRTESGALVHDWLWLDERPHVNVLARSLDGRFAVFEQRKYGIEGLTLAPVGGFIEAGEDAIQAAQRELKEEAGLSSEQWTSLGAYATSANRGGGTVHTFFADGCVSVRKGRNPLLDFEQQRLLWLSHEQLLEALLAGRFAEVKWTATLALALLRLSQDAATPPLASRRHREVAPNKLHSAESK